MRQLPVLICLALLLSAAAGTIQLGFLSFDAPIDPENEFPGVNAFNIADFTGEFELLPEFPVSTALTLMNATLKAKRRS
jgi:hypothetical protein